MQLVLIEWLDSYGCSSEWQTLENSRPKPLVCHSVGWLLYNGDDCKVVVPHISDPQNRDIPAQGCGDMTIPSQAIIRTVELTPQVATN